MSLVNKTIFNAGDKTGTGDSIAAVQLDTRDISLIGDNDLSQSFQFGGDYDGSWRITLTGGGNTQTGTSFNIQVRNNGAWIDKFSASQF